MNIKRFILWSKWQDPLGIGKDEIEYVPEKDVKKFDNDDEDLFDEDVEQEKDDEAATPVVITPLGILPIKPFNNPAKIFNFWLFETTFNISRKVAHIIKTTPGVEILDVFTRYKGRIAVGNNFKFQDTRQEIEKRLDARPPSSINKANDTGLKLDNNLKAQIQQLQVQLRQQFPYWAIYVIPNGKISFTGKMENTDEFNHHLKIYEGACKLAGGKVFKYDDSETI
jgi:hypothetical protein